MSEKPIIIVDFRERTSKIPELIVKKGASVKFNQLTLGDYIISERIAVERKTAHDFIKSIYDGRLFEQLKNLSDNYEIPILIVEGNMEEVLFEVQNPNIIRGALVSMAISYNAKIFYSENENETADYLVIIARQENKKEL
jgi:ERCC4-type nuclease